jgi:hypothetical protein
MSKKILMVVAMTSFMSQAAFAIDCLPSQTKKYDGQGNVIGCIDGHSGAGQKADAACEVTSNRPRKDSKNGIGSNVDSNQGSTSESAGTK